MSNSKLHDEIQPSDTNLEQHVQYDTTGMSDTLIDEHADVDDDSDGDAPYCPHDGDLSSSETDVAEDDAFIWKNLEHLKDAGTGEKACIYINHLQMYTNEIMLNIIAVSEYELRYLRLWAVMSLLSPNDCLTN